MPYESGILISVQNNLVRVKHPNIEYNPRTYLGASAAAAATTLTVRDNNEFLLGLTNNERVVIGQFGDEQAEIRRITADPTAGTSLAVVATTFAHPIDTPITMILWDQVEIYGNSTNSATGATLIVTMSLTPGEDFTQYTVSGTTYAFYLARYRNSTSATVSAYSDGVAAAGWGQGTRAMIKQRALARSGITLGFPVADGETITDEYLNAEIIACEQDIQQRSTKWAFLLTDNIAAPIALNQGQRIYTLPATILDDNSNRSIISARISWNRPLTYVYPEEFNSKTANVIFSTVGVAIGLADISVTLVDSGDFADSGDILVENDTMSYTANNRTTNVLSGITGISATHAAGLEVYQSASTGQPVYYTIKDGSIYLHPIPNADYNLRNLNIEFYRTLASMTGEGTVTAVPFFHVFDLFLLWRIAERRKIFDEAAKYEAEYERRMEQALRIHVRAQESKFYPGMADPQLLDFDKGRLLSSSLT